MRDTCPVGTGGVELAQAVGRSLNRADVPLEDRIIRKAAVLGWWGIRTMYKLKLKRPTPLTPPPITRTITASMLRRVTSASVYLDVARLREHDLDRPSTSTVSWPGVSESEVDPHFETFLDKAFAGRDGARGAVIEHLAWYGVGLDEEAANVVLDLWRRYGFNDEGVGHFADRVGWALSPPIRVLGNR